MLLLSVCIRSKSMTPKKNSVFSRVGHHCHEEQSSTEYNGYVNSAHSDEIGESIQDTFLSIVIRTDRLYPESFSNVMLYGEGQKINNIDPTGFCQEASQHHHHQHHHYLQSTFLQQGWPMIDSTRRAIRVTN